MMVFFTFLRPGSVFLLLFLLCATENGCVTAVEYFWSNAESGPSQGFHIVDNFMDGSGDENFTTSTESSNVTTTASQVCPVGYFGLNCAYKCYCKDADDICDTVYGNCSSGCHTGWYGPGCMAERRPGTIAVVVVLSLLLVLSLIVCFALCICIILNFIGNEKEKYRRAPDSPAGGGISYQSQESIGDNSPVPGDMKTTVPRIKETDIQVLHDVIGKGKFGNVNRGFIKKGTRNTEVAFKTLRENVSEEDRSNFLSLLELYSSIGQHENVVKFYGVCTVGGQIFAAFEYASHGNLKNFLKKNSVPESQRDSNSSRRLLSSKTTPIQFALDVANGMMYLSSKQIIHGKLCAKHVLLGSKYTAKISGLKPRGGMSQTVRWTAPEVIHEKKYSTQCDVWSFGVLLWEIVTFGSKPYSDVSTDDLYSRLKNGYRLPQPEGVDEQTYTLMKSCWALNPDDRPSFNKLSSNLREMVAAIEFQASIDSIDDIDLEVEDDLEFGSGRRFGRIAFDNSVFDIDA